MEIKQATNELLERNAHISTAEVEQDIADTEREIVDMRREEAGLRMIGDKMSVFRADARRSGIHEREAFVVKLRSLLDARHGD